LFNLRLTDSDLNLICKHSHKLEQLDILGSNGVSSEAVERVLVQCKHLKMFDISFCNNIDMITYKMLTEKYPHCSIKKSFQNEI
jgi:F-box and leucine-rich repeat protein 4